MKTKKIEVGETYFYRDSHGIEFVRVMQYVEGMGYWVKDPDGEYFWAEAEELEEV